MYGWIRSVTPDLFLAALVALLITLALHKMEGYEKKRIAAETYEASEGGLTFDEAIQVVGDSIRRSTRFYIPLLIVLGGAGVGLACRHRRWAWLTTGLAIIPAILTGVSFYLDTPASGGALTLTYLLLAAFVATSMVAARSRFEPVKISLED